MSCKNFILSTLVSLLSFGIAAGQTTPFGGDLTYRYLGNDEYEVTVHFFRNCPSTPGTIADVLVQSTSCGINGTTYTLNMISSGEVTPLCTANQNLSTCQGGSLFTGIWEEVYQGTISLPQACTDYQFSVTECCRSGAVGNLSITGSAFTLLAQLNNGTAAFNNSASFNASPSFILQAGQTYNLDFSATDVDGDSLVYEVVDPLRFASIINPYSSPYSSANPMNSLPPASIDRVTGIFTVTPTVVQNSVIAVRVREYRGNVLVGTVLRDVHLFVMNVGAYTNPPSLSGFDNTASITTYACVGDTIAFTIYTDDVDTNQTLVLDTLQTIPGATITINGGPKPSLNFSWIVDTTDVSALPYLLRLKVTDNGCPVTFSQTRVYKLYVTNCGAPVWPGDANSDFKADVYDLLPIGLAYGYNGPTRPLANIVWAPQEGNDWAWDFINGVNFKHVDCDGNGVVNADDTLAIVQNYGNTHLKGEDELRGSVTDPVLQFIAFDDTVLTGSNITIPIHLGTVQQPAEDVYGIAFSVFYDPTLVVADSISIRYPNSWLGSRGTDLITLEYNIPAAGQIDIGITRITQSAITGDGEICLVDIVMQDDITGKTFITAPLTFEFGGAKMINASGIELPITTQDLTITAKQFTAIGEVNTLDARVYPNPATDWLHITSPSLLQNIVVFNALGMEVLNQDLAGTSTKINMNDLAAGIYTARITDTSGRTKTCRIVRNINR